ncbi:MAG: hypothetical protein E7354_02390 [Clostridiales bacterium]|nr:hypothetical protein [Clostridiales bacterium]
MSEMDLTRKETQDNFVTERIDVYKNNLLGDYDDQGVYFISPQIIDELIKLPKQKTTSFDNSLFCVGDLLGFGQITFQLSFSKKTNNKAKASATLYLLEAVDKINGYMQNTIKTKLAVFQKTVTNFMESAFKFFNVNPKDTGSSNNDEDEGRGRKLVDDEMLSQSYILAKKQYSLFLEKLSDEKCLDAYGKYFTARYSALTKMNNPFSNAVLELFNEEYARIEKFFLKEKNYKILNELLDKCIEEISGTSENYAGQEQQFLDMTAGALETFTENVGKIHQKMGNKALNMLSKEDKEKMTVLKEGEERRNRENDAKDFQDTVAVYGEQGVVIEEAPPTFEFEVKEEGAKEVKENKVKEEAQAIQQPKEKEPEVKTKKASTSMSDIRGKLDAMRTKAKAQESVVKEEPAPKTPLTAEEKSRAKKSNYDEIYNYLNDQNRIKQEEEQRRRIQAQKDDMGMDM